MVMKSEIKYAVILTFIVWLGSCTATENDPKSDVKNSPLEQTDNGSLEGEIYTPPNEFISSDMVRKDDEPFILILKENTAQDEAIVSGSLAIEKNCLVLNTMGRAVTPVFQPEHNIKWVNEANHISYYGGAIKLGDRVSITGGFINNVEKSYNLLGLNDSPIPEGCPVEGYQAGRIGESRK